MCVYKQSTTFTPNVLDTFDAFSSLSGYKINWNKSVLFPLNGNITMSDRTQNIQVVNQFRYLGFNIYPNLGTIIYTNFQGLHDRIEADLNRLSFLPNSFQSRISVIKIDTTIKLFILNVAPGTTKRLLEENAFFGIQLL